MASVQREEGMKDITQQQAAMHERQAMRARQATWCQVCSAYAAYPCEHLAKRQPLKKTCPFCGGKFGKDEWTSHLPCPQNPLSETNITVMKEQLMADSYGLEIVIENRSCSLVLRDKNGTDLAKVVGLAAETSYYLQCLLQLWQDDNLRHQAVQLCTIKSALLQLSVQSVQFSDATEPIEERNQ